MLAQLRSLSQNEHQKLAVVAGQIIIVEAVVLVLEEFGRVIAYGGVVVSSMAGTGSRCLRTTSPSSPLTAPEELTALPVVQAATEAAAYPLAKRGNHLRVQAASAQRAARGG